MNEEIKIEADDSAMLQELQEFLYNKQPDLDVTPITAMQPGFHKEPISVAIIIALGGPVVMKTVQVLIKEFFTYRKEVAQQKTQREKDKQNTKISLIKISTREGKSWKYLDTDKFTQVKL